MASIGWTVFDTALGEVGLAWSEVGVSGVSLPEPGEGAVLARMRRANPGAECAARRPPTEVAAAVDGIRALLGGAPRDLREVAVDLSGAPAFHQAVYEVARAIPPGRTLGYGEVAARLGEPGAARAVGRALGANPVPIIVPCHRVLAAGGEIGGFSAPGGAETKRRMLVIEGALADQPTLFG